MIDEDLKKSPKGWAVVFERLYRDREKILVQDVSIKGKKKRFVSEECVFFLGDLKGALSMDGWKFIAFAAK